MRRLVDINYLLKKFTIKRVKKEIGLRKEIDSRRDSSIFAARQKFPRLDYFLHGI